MNYLYFRLLLGKVYQFFRRISECCSKKSCCEVTTRGSIDSNQPRLRCGVIGVGSLGQHHARIYSELPGCELIGVYDTNKVRAKEIANLYGARVFDDVEALAQYCQAISVVVPTNLHAQVSIPLLQRGCHLLIEKPLCASLEEAEAIVSAAREHSCIVQVGHVEQFNPVVSFLEKAVQDPRYITVERLSPFSTRGSEVGVVLDLMIHDIGIILQLVKSSIERIDAVGFPILTKTEDIANARIVFKNGCVANINASRVSLKKVREIRIFQPNAYLSLDFMNQSGHLIERVGSGIEKQTIPIEKGQPLALELRAFTDCVQRSLIPKVDVEFGRSALEVALSITEIIREQNAKLPYA
jgi:predicted dehydrogenase